MTNEPAVRGSAVLVVDDDPAILMLVKDFLHMEGHEVDVALSGFAAFDKLRQRTYDVILSDVRMAAVDGLAFYRMLESGRFDILRRFIFITGNLSPEVADFAQQRGVPVLEKPFALMALRRAIADVLEPPVECAGWLREGNFA